MTYVVVELCVDCKYTDCAAVCPVEAFHELPIGSISMPILVSIAMLAFLSVRWKQSSPIPTFPRIMRTGRKSISMRRRIIPSLVRRNPLSMDQAAPAQPNKKLI